MCLHPRILILVGFVYLKHLNPERRKNVTLVYIHHAFKSCNVVKLSFPQEKKIVLCD